MVKSNRKTLLTIQSHAGSSGFACSRCDWLRSFNRSIKGVIKSYSSYYSHFAWKRGGAVLHLLLGLAVEEIVWGQYEYW